MKNLKERLWTISEYPPPGSLEGPTGGGLSRITI